MENIANTAPSLYDSVMHVNGHPAWIDRQRIEHLARENSELRVRSTVWRIACAGSVLISGILWYGGSQHKRARDAQANALKANAGEISALREHIQALQERIQVLTPQREMPAFQAPQDPASREEARTLIIDIFASSYGLLALKELKVVLNDDLRAAEGNKNQSQAQRQIIGALRELLREVEEGRNPFAGHRSSMAKEWEREVMGELPR